MNQTSISTDEKRAYIERIEKKAMDENISLKQASHRLGAKIWAYNKYKTDLRLLDADRCRSETGAGKVGAMEKHGPPMPKTVTLTLSEDVYLYFEKEAKRYATGADVVAQLLLHDCVRGKIKASEVKECLTK